MKTSLKIKTLIGFLGTLGFSASSQAIVSFGELNGTTNIIGQALEKQTLAYKAHYKTEDLTHFWFRASQAKLNDKQDQVYNVTVDPQAVMNELAEAEKLRFPNSKIRESIAEDFDQITANLKQRGFVPLKSEKELQAAIQFSYDRTQSKAGGEKNKHSDKKVAEYIHWLNFEYQVEYTKEGKDAEQMDSRPRAFIKGIVILTCEAKIKNCSIYNISFKSSGIEQIMLPTARGGRSSAGGN